MNILVITNMYPSDDIKWRGIFVREQVERLRESNINVDVINIQGKGYKRGSRLNYLKAIFTLWHKILTNKYELIHSHHSLCTLIARFQPFIPILYTIHEGKIISRPKSIESLVIKLAIKLANFRIYVNKQLYDNSHAKNKFFLPCGIDLKKFKILNKQQTRKELGLKQDKTYIFFPADPKRREKNPQFAYDFIDQNEAFLEHENIEWLFGGNIDYSDMPKWMNSANIMVSFSEFESDGMVFKEALACNLPVITFDVGNAGVYFGDNQNGSIINKNIDELKNKILFWKSNKTSGRNSILESGYDLDSTNTRLIHIYKKIIYG